MLRDSHLLRCGLAAILVLLLTPDVFSQTRVPDSTLRRDVENAFGRDYRLHDASILVRASSGVVTLRGELPSLFERHAADRIARRTTGVDSVMNFIVVRPAQSDDEKILQDIEQRFEQDKRLELAEMKVLVNNGAVTLYGNAAAWRLSRQVERIVRDVRGVRSIQNELRVSDPPQIVADDRLLADINSIYACDAYLGAFQLEVIVNSGNVKLNGIVPNLFLKERAANQARSVNGVRTVNNQIVTSAHMILKSVPVQLSDSELVEHLRREFSSDPRLESHGIDPRVMHGEVTLWGWVDSIYSKRLAARITRQWTGIRRITNELVVRSDSRKDHAILQEIQAIFASDALLTTEAITPLVQDGYVRLSGSVSAHPIRVRATNLVSRISGVRDITNDLEVSVAPVRSDALIKQDIVAGLAANAITRGRVDGVNISVHDAVVMLTGEVDRYVTLLEVLRLASFTDSVRQVENQLEVRGK